VALVSVSCVFKAFIGVTVTFLERVITFISRGSLAIEKSFKTVKAGVADNIKGVIERNLK
jgi:hypothetical protein